MGQESSGQQQMWSLVGELPRQLEASWQQGADGVQTRDVSAVKVVGMGGSAVAAELVGAVLDPARMSVSVLRDYALRHRPAPGTLLVFSSYSGNTEETLAAWEDAARYTPDCPRVIISSGGQLAKLAQAASVPCISLPPDLPPRASLGHGVGALCALLEAVGDPGLAEQVPATLQTLDSGNRRWGLDGQPAADSSLEQLAAALDGRLPVLYTGCALTHAVARRWRGQINENAKLLVTTAELPELDHNEVVGWGQDTLVRQQARVVALRDCGEVGRIALRFSATRQALGLSGDSWFERCTGPGPALARMMGLVQEGDVLSCLLARRAGVDPVPVKVIDGIKQQLARESS